MNQDIVVTLDRGHDERDHEVALPMLLAGLVVGLLISIFQAVTQIQEQTLSFVPKILALSRWSRSPARGCSSRSSTGRPTCGRCSRHSSA